MCQCLLKRNYLTASTENSTFTKKKKTGEQANGGKDTFCIITVLLFVLTNFSSFSVQTDSKLTFHSMKMVCENRLFQNI